MPTSAAFCSGGVKLSNGLATSCAAWYTSISASLYKHALTHAHKIVTPSCSAAFRSGGSFCSAMKSDARKSGLTSNTATLDEDKAWVIFSRHLAPASILVSFHMAMLFLRTNGLSIVCSLSSQSLFLWL